MVNATMLKFGYPGTLIAEFDNWVVLLRPVQVTLGSLVLAAKDDATAYSDLPEAAFTEQSKVVRAIESALRRFCSYERINYLMLMMVDPNVHFHVIPRYSDDREWNGMTFTDHGWPRPPELKLGTELAAEQVIALRREIKAHF